MLLDHRSLLALPEGSELQHITFVTEAAAGQSVVMDLPDPVRRRAVLVGARAVTEAKAPPVPAGDLLVLSVVATELDDADLLAKLREWVDSPAPDGSLPTQLLTLQGAQIVWGRGRVAVVAKADRLESVRKALIEVSYYEAELRDIERELSERWPHLEADAPLAFEFDEKAVRKRRQIAQRFQQLLALRARLARITPHVLCPHTHPPTLASQVGERLRERTRMPQRLEFLGGQLEVFERVYESCGQRASDFMLARTGHTLEWVIIILLLAQTLLVGFDLMTSLGK